MENLPRRKEIRLSEYDYSQNGYYFVTVCTRDKQPIFWEPVGADIIRPEIRSNDGGRLIAAPTDATPTGRGGYHPPKADATYIGRGGYHPPETETPPVRLSAYGKIVDQAIQNIPAAYPNVFVDTYVIMPNHIHMILVISGAPLPEQDTSPPNLMRVIGQMKRWVSQNAGIPIWQKSFYEHIIRNYDDYINTAQYILNNPRKWMMNP